MPVPFLIAGTDRIGLIQRRLAEKLATAAGIRMLPLPGRTERFTQSFQWHPLFAYDSAHKWLRAELAACAEELRPGARSAGGSPAGGVGDGNGIGLPAGHQLGLQAS
ncbi:hypothetical protein [Streptomyces sp. NPDC003247]|uniref:hypothetical protein n=1 Tax=Streptomyces sp. NPDC003247 TaxID=3364677 RepID=UPI0036C35198